MSYLSDGDILEAVGRGRIVITPFDRACLGTNSYDVHLASTLRVYAKKTSFVYTNTVPAYSPGGFLALPTEVDDPLDVRIQRPTIDVQIPSDGIVLEPGELYLASTVEHTESHHHLPVLNGRSSLGRLGLSIHVTAGTGDVGFRGCWTMELFVVKRLRVYAGIPVGQLLWAEVSSPPLVPYGNKSSAKYNDAGGLPQASKLHEELARAGED